MKTSKTSSPRRIIALALTPKAERVVSQVKEDLGITQVGFLERLLEWYAGQDPRLRMMILNPYPQVRQGLARLIVEEMQGDPDKDFDALPGFDALIDHDYGGGETSKSSRNDSATSHRIQPRKRRA